MNLFWNRTGPYFDAPCQRDRFPSLLDELGETGDKLVAHLGISNMSDMGARLKRGYKATAVEEKRASDYVKEVCLPLQKIFCSSAQDLRRGVDKYVQIPKYFLCAFMPTDDPRELTHRYRKLVISKNSEVARRQVGEPPYTGNCSHCRRSGSNDVSSDRRGRLFLQEACILGEINMVMEVDEEPDEVFNRNYG